MCPARASVVAAIVRRIRPGMCPPAWTRLTRPLSPQPTHPDPYDSSTHAITPHSSPIAPLTPVPPVFRIKVFASKSDLQAAVDACLNENPSGNCPKQQGSVPMNQRDVSRVNNMDNMFSGKWRFIQDLSRWDVKKGKSMQCMFYSAFVFDKILCSDAWILSRKG